MRVTPVETWLAGKIGAPGASLDLSALRTFQLARLNETLAHVWEQSRFYRGLLGSTAPYLDSLEQLRNLQFTTDQQVRDDPHGFLCMSPGRVERIVTLPTSGTTGPPKRLFFSAADQELTRDFFHHGMSTLVEPGDRVGILLPGSLPGSVGTLLDEGLARMEVTSVVLGPVHDPEETLARLAGERCTAIVGIPVQVLELARLNRARPQYRLAVRSVLLSTDRMPQAALEAIQSIWSCTVFDHYGMTEMGLGGGVDCAARVGYHLREADLLFEIVDPVTGQPVLEGEPGEVVFTTLTRDAMPLVRYRTGDVSRFIPGACPCGSVLRRLAHIDARLDSAVPIGARCITQKELDECLLPLPGVVDVRGTVEYQNDSARLRVAVKWCAGYAPLDTLKLKNALRGGIAALAGSTPQSVDICIEEWDPHAPGSTGTAKRRVKVQNASAPCRFRMSAGQHDGDT